MAVSVIAVLWLALGVAVMAALWVAHQAEVRTARLLAAVPGWQDENTDPWRTP